LPGNEEGLLGERVVEMDREGVPDRDVVAGVIMGVVKGVCSMILQKER